MAELTDADLNAMIGMFRSTGFTADQANQLVLGGEDDTTRFPAIEQAKAPDVPFPLSTVVSVGKDYPIVPADDVVLVDATAAPITVTLPAAAFAARRVSVKKTDVSINAVTVGTAGSDTIDLAATVVLGTQFQVVTVISDLTAWWVL